MGLNAVKMYGPADADGVKHLIGVAIIDPATGEPGAIGTVDLSAAALAALENITAVSTIGDGADVTQGAIADAAATAGGTGTMSAKLRRISAQLLAGLPGSLGQQAAAASTSVVLASDATKIVTVNPVVDTAIYTALEIIGGILTLTDAALVSGGGAVLQSITLTDDDNEKAAFDILLFNASPVGGTYADQGAFVHHANDIPKLIGRIQVLASDWVTVVAGSLAIATIRNIALPVVASGSANLFALLILTGGPTYTATSDLTLKFGFLR